MRLDHLLLSKTCIQSSAPAAGVEKSHFGALAQLGEHLLCKQGVVGSIPTGSTTKL